MKNILIFLLIGTLFLSFAGYAFAQSSVNATIQATNLDFAQEKLAVLDGLVNPSDAREVFVDVFGDEFENISSEDLEYGQAYRVNPVKREFLMSLIDGKDIKGKNTEHYWEFPIILKETQKPVSSCTVAFFEEKWQVSLIGNRLTLEDSLLSSNPQDIEKLFVEQGINDGISFEHIRKLGFHLDLLYLDSKSGEYFIPLIHGGWQELYGLKNRQLVTRDELVIALEPTIKAGTDKPGLLGGASEVASKITPKQGFLTIAALLFCVYVVFRFRRRKSL